MKSKKRRSFAFPVLFLLFISSANYSQEVGHIKWIPCIFSDCSDLDGHRIRFGKIRVPENYALAENGRSLQIAFALIKARTQPSKPDPVLIFAGGWGSPTLKYIHYFSEHFLGEERDLILYDYRGLGYSDPIICPGLEESVYEKLIAPATYKEFQNWQIEAFDACLDDLKNQGIDGINTVPITEVKTLIFWLKS